jgi:23S rRNA pseudouridine1911/1915/1917 synthase
MNTDDAASFVVEPPGGITVLAALRQAQPGISWSAARKLLGARRVLVNEVLCVDEGRRVAAGDRLAIVERSQRSPPTVDAVQIRFIDSDIVVVEKPAGMTTLRRAEEQSWPAHRRQLQPTLDEAVALRIAEHAARKSKRDVGARLPRLWAVHRLDRDTSGLLIFARSAGAQERLIAQFAAHTAVRKYLAIVRGEVRGQTIRSRIVRDRGDGLRGTTSDGHAGQLAITHVKLLRKFVGHCELECRLETGRTNQIRIHLAELGHPICGDIKYRGSLGAAAIAHQCSAPRLALHSAQLRIEHPTTGESLCYDSPWPGDVAAFLDKLVS